MQCINTPLKSRKCTFQLPLLSMIHLYFVAIFKQQNDNFKELISLKSLVPSRTTFRVISRLAASESAGGGKT